MKLTNIMIGAALLIAPAQASIIITQAGSDPGLALSQTFGVPVPTIGANFTPVTDQFQFSPGVGLSFLGNAVYDPNHAAGGTCSDFGVPSPNCITNFTENSDTSYNTITSTSLTFTLTNPATEVAFFLLSDEIDPTTTQISVNGGLAPTNFSFGAGPWFDIKGNGIIITSVTILGLNASTAIAAGHAYGLVLGNVESTTPEPGTILMFSAGLGAVALFARRRKA